MEDAPSKPVLKSNTMRAGIAGLAFVLIYAIADNLLGLGVLDSGTLTAIAIGALSLMGFRLTTKSGIQGFKLIFIIPILCLAMGFTGCLNTRVLSGGVNGVGAAGTLGPIVLGAFAGKMYAGVIDADLAEGEGIEWSDKHAFKATAGIASVGTGADGDAAAEGIMDREFKGEIYQVEDDINDLEGPIDDL